MRKVDCNFLHLKSQINDVKVTEKTRRQEITVTDENNHRLIVKFWNVAVPLSGALTVSQTVKIENIQTAMYKDTVSCNTMDDTAILVSKAVVACKKCDFTCEKCRLRERLHAIKTYAFLLNSYSRPHEAFSSKL
jgi:hypothetical protein